MIKIAHIINPVKIGDYSDLFLAQPITFESLKRAKAYAHASAEVKLLTTQYSEDREIIPNYFEITEDLEKSVLDYGEFQKPRKLPLLKDILEKAYLASEGFDYLIYSNVDISVQPYFYKFIADTVESGIDAFVINRRTISGHFTSNSQLEEMYAEIGAEHAGHDCFVFKRDLYPSLILEKTIIGASWIGRVLIWNLYLRSQNFKEFYDSSLTFHIGDDMVWKEETLNDFYKFNKIQADSVFRKLKPLLANYSADDHYLVNELKLEELRDLPLGRTELIIDFKKHKEKTSLSTKEKIKFKLKKMIDKL